MSMNAEQWGMTLRDWFAGQALASGEVRDGEPMDTRCAAVGTDGTAVADGVRGGGLVQRRHRGRGSTSVESG